MYKHLVVLKKNKMVNERDKRAEKPNERKGAILCLDYSAQMAKTSQHVPVTLPTNFNPKSFETLSKPNQVPLLPLPFFYFPLSFTSLVELSLAKFLAKHSISFNKMTTV